MDRYAKLAELLKGLVPNPTTLIAVEVISVEGDTCTVRVGADGLEVDGVFLRPTTAGENKILLTPKVGSFVMVGSQSGDLRQLTVLSADELQKVEVTSENMSLLIDVEEGVISVKNGEDERLTMDVAKGTTTFNGGSLGGLVILQKLVDNLTSIKDFAEAINSALPSAFNAIGSGTGANGANGASSYSGSMGSKAITLDDMENKNISYALVNVGGVDNEINVTWCKQVGTESWSLSTNGNILEGWVKNARIQDILPTFASRIFVSTPPSSPQEGDILIVS